MPVKMQWSGLFTFWVVSLSSFVGIQALVFDILRNSSTVTSQDFCAKLHCQVKRDNQTPLDIQHVISLVISQVDAEQNTATRLAGLSFFEPGVHVYGSPTKVSASGQLVPKDGELNVYLKDIGKSCQSGTFACELKFINSQNKGEIVKAHKKLVVVKDVVKEEERGHLNSGTFNYLKAIMSDEVSKIREQSENLTNIVVSAMTSMSQRLHRLESTINGDLHTRLHALDQKLTKLEMMLSENVENKLTSLTELMENSTDSLKSYVTDRFNATQEQLNRLEFSIEDQDSSRKTWINESFNHSSAQHIPCMDSPTNISAILQQVQDQVSTFKAEVMGKLSAAETRLENSSARQSTRLIVETLIRMGHNISETDSKINRLKTDLSSEMNMVRLNISSLSENMLNRHGRFARQVKDNIDNFENKLSTKFVELDRQKESLTTFDSDVKGKLLNIEINLKDINIVLKNIKYFFGL